MYKVHQPSFDLMPSADEVSDELLDAPWTPGHCATPQPPRRVAQPRRSPPTVPPSLVGRGARPRKPGPTLMPFAAAPTFIFEGLEDLPTAEDWDATAEEWFESDSLGKKPVWLAELDPSAHPDAPLPQFRRAPRVQLVWALPPIGLALTAVATALLMGVI